MDKRLLIIAVTLHAIALIIGISALVYAHKQVGEINRHQAQIAELARVFGASGIVEIRDGQILINRITP